MEIYLLSISKKEIGNAGIAFLCRHRLNGYEERLFLLENLGLSQKSSGNSDKFISASGLTLTETTEAIPKSSGLNNCKTRAFETVS